MDTSLYIDLPKTAYAPGETVSGTLFWVLPEPPEEIRLTAGWWTEGRGTKDAQIEMTREWQTTSLAGEEKFSLTLPTHPYSFSGTLISLIWAIELSTRQGEHSVSERITLSPLDHPIQLAHIDEGGNKSISVLRRR